MIGIGSGYYSISYLNTQYLRLDASNDPVTGQLDMSNHIIPTNDGFYDLGDSTNFWRTLYINNDGGDVISCKRVLSGDTATNYIMDCGGGSVGIEQNQGGTFTFLMNDIINSAGTSVNQCIFNLGQVDFLTAVTNDMIFLANNGIAEIGFIVAFGGFSNPEYGFQLRNISGADANGKKIIFDNQTIINDINRSIDFRISTTNILTIENETSPGAADYTVDFSIGLISSPGLLSITAPTGLQINGYGAITSSTVFNLVDIFTVKATTTNRGVIFGMRPDGTDDSSLINCTNSSDSQNYGVWEGSLDGTIARLATWRLGTGTGATELRIGEMVSSFLGVGICDALTTIDFYFANAIEMQIQPDIIIFNNGAIDTQIDWSNSGELGLQVATNDIIRISATLATIFQNTNITGNLTFTTDNNKIYFGTSQDVDMYYDGTYYYLRTDLQNSSDFRLDCGIDKTLELQESVWDDLNVGGVTLRQGAANQPSLINFDTTTILVYSFSSSATNELHGNFEIIHNYKEGTNLKPHLHWYPQNTNTGNVLWRLEYTIESIIGTVVNGTIDLLVAANGTAWQGQFDTWTDITGTSVQIGDQFHFRLARIGGDATDTYTGNAAIATFGLHYEIDTMGSRQVTTK
jgi:hypothetical protein